MDKSVLLNGSEPIYEYRVAPMEIKAISVLMKNQALSRLSHDISKVLMDCSFNERRTQMSLRQYAKGRCISIPFNGI